MTRSDVQDWREAYRAMQTPGTENCPTDEQLAELLVETATDSPQRSAIADHALECERCSHSMLLAARLHGQAQAAPPTNQAGRSRWPWLAIAAGLVLVVVAAGLTLRPQAPLPSTQTRGMAEPSIASSLSGATLERSAFRLTWALNDEATSGVRFDVVVSNEQLDVLHQRRGLENTEYVVPFEALADVPSGATLIWKVEARGPDGRLLATNTFTSLAM